MAARLDAQLRAEAGEGGVDIVQCERPLGMPGNLDSVPGAQILVNLAAGFFDLPLNQLLPIRRERPSALRGRCGCVLPQLQESGCVTEYSQQEFFAFWGSSEEGSIRTSSLFLRGKEGGVTAALLDPKAFVGIEEYSAFTGWTPQHKQYHTERFCSSRYKVSRDQGLLILPLTLFNAGARLQMHLC